MRAFYEEHRMSQKQFGYTLFIIFQHPLQTLTGKKIRLFTVPKGKNPFFRQSRDIYTLPHA